MDQNTINLSKLKDQLYSTKQGHNSPNSSSDQLSSYQVLLYLQSSSYNSRSSKKYRKESTHPRPNITDYNPTQSISFQYVEQGKKQTKPIKQLNKNKNKIKNKKKQALYQGGLSLRRKSTELRKYELRKIQKTEKNEFLKTQLSNKTQFKTTKGIQFYSQISQLFRKIYWDSLSGCSKINTRNFFLLVQFMTPACFWFQVSCEYFPLFDFYNTKGENLFNEAMQKINEIQFGVSLKLRSYKPEQQVLGYFIKTNLSQNLSQYLMKQIKVKNDISDFDQIINQEAIKNQKKDQTNDIQWIIDFRKTLWEILSRQLLFHNQLQQFILSQTHLTQITPQYIHNSILTATNQLSLDYLITLLQQQYQHHNKQIESNYPKIQQFLLPLKPTQLCHLYTPKFRQQLQFLEYVQKKKNYYDKDPTQQQNDAKCCICYDGDYTEDDLIVYCQGCNITVHQKCYNILKIPEDLWFCDLCQAFGPAGKYMMCPLCTMQGGCLKKSSLNIDTQFFKQINPRFHQFICNSRKYRQNDNIQNYDRSKIKNQMVYYDYNTIGIAQQNDSIKWPIIFNIWVHYCCALFIPQTYIDSKTQNIRGLQHVDKKRFKGQCKICQKKSKFILLDSGAVIKCENEICHRSYHPECAKRANNFLEQTHDQKSRYHIFCEEHKPLKIMRLIESKQKKHNNQIIKFYSSIMKYIESYKININLAKHKLKGKKDKKKSKLQIQNQNIYFINCLLRHIQNPPYQSTIDLILISQQPLAFKIQNYNIQSFHHIKSNYQKNDQIWDSFKYSSGIKGVNLWKKWKRILKQKGKARIIWTNGIKILKQRNQFYEGMLIQIERSFLTILYMQKTLYLRISNECLKCKNWYHYQCVGFCPNNSKEYQQNEQVDFFCQKCVESLQEQKKNKYIQQTKKKYFVEPKIKYNPYLKYQKNIIENNVNSIFMEKEKDQREKIFSSHSISQQSSINQQL